MLKDKASLEETKEPTSTKNGPNDTSKYPRINSDSNFFSRGYTMRNQYDPEDDYEEDEDEQEKRGEKKAINPSSSNKFNSDEIEYIQRAIQEMTKKIEHEKIDLRICIERYEKKNTQYCQLQGKPVPLTKEEKEKQKLKEKKTKKPHKVADPIVRKRLPEQIIEDNHEKTMKDLTLHTKRVEELTNDINILELNNSELKDMVIEYRRQKEDAIKSRNKVDEINKEKQERNEQLKNENDMNEKKIKTAQLKQSMDKNASQRKSFEKSRDELEAEYHKVIEEYIKREREAKKEQAKKRQMLAMIADSKSGFKTQNAGDLEKQIKLLENDEISDRTPIIEEILAKWKEINKIKKGMIDKYSKNASIIHNALEMIQHYCGVSDIEILPIVYSKAMDQKCDIDTYISKLNEELDTLKYKKEVINEKIKYYSDKKNSKSKNEDDFKIEKQNKIARLENDISEIEDDIEQKMLLFTEIKPKTNEFLTKLNNTYLSDYVEDKLQIDPSVIYNEVNSPKFLSNVADYYTLITMFEEYAKEKLYAGYDNSNIDKLSYDMKVTLDNFEKNKVMNHGLYSSIKEDRKAGMTYDDIIKRSSNAIIDDINNNQNQENLGKKSSKVAIKNN